MIEMQGVPIYDDALFAWGVSSLFDHSLVSASALRKMAGNSFSQPCMSAFLAFTLAHLKPADSAAKEEYQPSEFQIIYNSPMGSDDDDGDESDGPDDAEDIN